MPRLITLLVKTAPVIGATLSLTAPLLAASDDLAKSHSTPAEVSWVRTSESGSFTVNLGQWPDTILFRAVTQGVTVWFTGHGLLFQVPEFDPHSNAEIARQWRPGNTQELLSPQKNKTYSLVPLRFVAANPDPPIEGYKRLQRVSNYFFGNDPAQWHTNVPSYERLIYKNLYDGIDYVFYFKNGCLEYDIIAAPGSDISDVRLSFEPPDAAEIDESGSLLVFAGPTTIRQHIPHVFQRSVAGERELAGLWCRRQPGEFGVTVTDEISPALALVVDPVLTFGTYLGGTATEVINAVAANASGDVAVTGYTTSANFPTVNPVQGTLLGDDDVFVVKYSGSDNSVVFSTYIGGTDASSNREEATAIDIDASGNVYVGGNTWSSNFPTAHAIQPVKSTNADCFVLKLEANGDSLIYSTYYGGTGAEYFFHLIVDDQGSLYGGGETYSSDFLLENPLQDSLTSEIYDAFIFKLTPAGDRPEFSTYFGGTLEEYVLRLTIDADHNVYALGWTNSLDFPLTPTLLAPGILESVNSTGGWVPWLAKLSSLGDSLIFSSYVNPNTTAKDIVVDASRNLYIAGNGYNGLPVVNAYQPTFGGGTLDMYVAKLSPNFDEVMYATYFGASADEIPFDLEVDTDGRIFLAGWGSNSFPTGAPFEGAYASQGSAAQGGKMAAVLLSPDGGCKVFSTIISGGFSSTTSYPVWADMIAPGEFVMAGSYKETDQPLVDPVQTYGGFVDGYIARISHSLCGVTNTGDVNLTCDITSADIITLVNYVFKSGPEPLPCPAAGDVNCDGVVTSADIIYLVIYVFKGGQPPCDVCTIFPGSWTCP